MKTNLINYNVLGNLAIVLIILLMAFSIGETFAANATINETSSGGILLAVNDVTLNSGDTLFLTPGIYNKTNEDTNITINKSLTLQGNGSTNNVIIDARGQNRVFTIANNINLTFINITFINGFTTDSGAAIYNIYGDTLLTFTNCSFNNNFANGTYSCGGAIYNNGHNLSIHNSSFYNNSAVGNTSSTGNSGCGGAIYNNGNNFSVYNSTFYNNVVIIYNNSVGYSGCGAAICNFGNYFNLADSNFTRNRGHQGGAVYNRGFNFSVIDSNFTNNVAIHYAGAIYNYYGHNFTVKGSNFINNSVPDSGGAIHSSFSDNITIINSNFFNNSATLGGAFDNNGNNVEITNSSFINNSGFSAGGAISNYGSNFTVIGVNFTNNSAGSGGAIYTGGNYIFAIPNFIITGSNFTIKDSNFVNNTAGYDGGAIYNGGYNYYNNSSNLIASSGPNLFITSSNFINNNATMLGGAIFNKGDNFTINNSIFNNNTGGIGGAIYNTVNINTTVSGSTFNNNIATNVSDYGGGAIFNNGESFDVINSSFNYNTAERGGAIWNSGSYFRIFNSNFTNNSATYGGAFYNSRYGTSTNLNYTISNSVFINNSATVNGGAFFNNFAIYINISGSTFINNHAGLYGGAIASNSNLTSVYNSIFINNSASSGGAIYNSNTGDAYPLGINLTIFNSTFTDNYASNGGGAIYNLGNYFNLANSNFTRNNANNGGALYNYGDFSSVIYSNFSNNNASGASASGGGIYNRANDFLVINSNFTNNIASYGGGIFNTDNGSIVVNGSIFNNNTQAIGLGNINYELNNNTIINNIIAVQFVLNNETYIIPDLIGLTTPSINVNLSNLITNNTYAIGISGNYSNYTLADSSYNTSNNKNAVIFTGIGLGSTNSGVSNGNTLINSLIRGYSGVGLTFDMASLNNRVYNCNISDNDVGVVISGNGNSITSSNIIDNAGLGINVTSTGINSIINYNRIFNKFIYGLTNYGNFTDANYNWWGENNIVSQYYNNPGSNLDLNFYYVLQLSLNYTLNNTVDRNRTYAKDVFANLSYELTLNDASVSHDKSLLPYFIVNILLNNSTSVILNFTQDAREDYNWTNVIITNSDSSAQIRVLADNGDVYLRIGDYNNSVNLTITKVANVTEVVVNETVQYVITVTNHGPNAVNGVEVYEILPNGLVYLNSSTTIGTYNPTTGLWYIGSLASGQTATFIINTRVVANGTIINIVTLTTTDRAGDMENANATITVVSEPDEDSDPVLDSDEPVYETNDTQTNAPRASMKHTGMPLIATLLVLISLIALGTTKKTKINTF